MDLQEAIARESVQIDRVMRQDLAGLAIDDELLKEILEYGLFSGGKRIRPFLVVLGARLCGRSDEAVYRSAIAFEYLHAATLFHDDVIDHADTRRGRLSVIKRYGMVGAILAGDFLHAHAMALVGRFGGQAALDTFTAATRGMVEGEFLQLRAAGKWEVSADDYFAIVRRKTGVLIEAACVTGGIVAGADAAQRAALQTYGGTLGTAFQIIDDLLDYQGQFTGKRIGNDLAEGKSTLPLIIALDRAPERERQNLLALLQSASLRSERLDEIVAFIDRHAGFVEARRRAEQLIDSGLTALQVFSSPCDHPARELLEGLGRYVLSRQR